MNTRRTPRITSRPLTSSIVLFGALTLLAGCQSIAPPALSVTGAQAGERTPDGVSMIITLDATNSNDVALPLRDVVYTVDIDGQRVFEGTRSPEATLRRSGTQQIKLPAVVNITRSGDSALASSRFRVSGTMRYITPGQIAEILFDTGVRVPSVSFSGEGDVNLSAAKAFAPAPGATYVPLPDTAPPPESPVTLP